LNGGNIPSASAAAAAVAACFLPVQTDSPSFFNLSDIKGFSDIFRLLPTQADWLF
jgi:hypothetical protein